MKQSLRDVTLMALVLFLLAPSVFAVRTRARGFSALIVRNNFHDVISDFDGDRAPDESKLRSRGLEKIIEVRFANLRHSQLRFNSPFSDCGNLFAIDIDRDGDIDLVWIAKTPQRNDVVWLNDGRGNFQAAKDDRPYVATLEELSARNDSEDKSSVSNNAAVRNFVGAAREDISPAPATLPVKSFKSLVEPFDNQPQHESIPLSSIHKRGPPSRVP